MTRSASTSPVKRVQNSFANVYLNNMFQSTGALSVDAIKTQQLFVQNQLRFHQSMISADYDIFPNGDLSVTFSSL